jgi:hypothetical protein
MSTAVPTETVVESWKELVAVIQERGWQERQVFWVRLTFGALLTKWYGPFRTEEKARQVFIAITDERQFGEFLEEVAVELGNQAGCLPIDELWRDGC